jgi:phosphoribosylanthranilate isomerase
MYLKVCGMRESANIQSVLTLEPDWMGFIFYPHSKRYFPIEQAKRLADWNASTKKVGVFVNQSTATITHIAAEAELDLIQLHGDETPEFCNHIREIVRKPIIKAFGIGADFDFEQLAEYEGVCDYFLFDTKATSYGGSGKVFEWELLKKYTLSKPFLLSGGISLDNLPDLIIFLQSNPLPVYALDINSKFELAPALKVVRLIRKFKETLVESGL